MDRADGQLAANFERETSDQGSVAGGQKRGMIGGGHRVVSKAGGTIPNCSAILRHSLGTVGAGPEGAWEFSGGRRPTDMVSQLRISRAAAQATSLRRMRGSEAISRTRDRWAVAPREIPILVCPKPRQGRRRYVAPSGLVGSFAPTTWGSRPRLHPGAPSGRSSYHLHNVVALRVSVRIDSSRFPGPQPVPALDIRRSTSRGSCCTRRSTMRAARA